MIFSTTYHPKQAVGLGSDLLRVLAIMLLGVLWQAGPTANASSQHAFSIQQEGEVYWLTKPDGARFFSLGVCCVNQGDSAKEWNPANPAYAAWRHYHDTNAWASATVGRLKSWGFTTIGGWSDFATLGACRDDKLVFTPVLHIGATAGAPWWDMWDPKVVERMDQVAREAILRMNDDPRVMGYYTDNEIGWWNGILTQMTFQQAPTSGQRQRLIGLLRETYQNNWSALMDDFETAPVMEGWNDLDRHGVLYLRPGGNGIRVERKFLAMLADRYYSLVRDIVRKYAPKALVLGDRFPSFYYPEVVRSCARYVDAISSNLNPVWNDGSFPRFYLETLHVLSGKPIIIGEFYVAARENRSGNRNTHGVYPVVATQKERAAAFQNTLHRLIGSPWVIGADWFQYYDEPTHGRFDGENFNFGLVDINDSPYAPITSTAAGFDPTRIQHRSLPQIRGSAQSVPQAPANPFAGFEPGLALKDWDRVRGFVKPKSEFPLADLYVCWKKDAIYLGLCAQDVVEDTLYRGKTVLGADRAEWVISIPGLSKPIRGRVGSGMEPVMDEPSVRAMSMSGINGNTRNIVALEIPAKLFGRKRLKAGDAIEFASTFFTHCRAYSVEWEARLPLSGK